MLISFSANALPQPAVRSMKAASLKAALPRFYMEVLFAEEPKLL